MGRASAGAAPVAKALRLPLLDSCRALAALSILVFHVTGNGGTQGDGALEKLGLGLAIGVPVFFAISGFVLYRPFAAAHLELRAWPAVGTYARRRVLRIVPAYWVALTALGLAAGLPGVFSDDWWRYYGLVQIYDATSFDKGISVAWTLCIEVTFYMVLPVYALAMARMRRHMSPATGFRRELAVLAALAIASVVFRALTAIPDTNISAASTLPGTFFWFVPGMALAVWSVAAEAGAIDARVVSGRRFAPLCWLAAGGLYLALCYSGISPVAGDVLAGAIAGLFLLPAICASPGAARRSFPERLLATPALIWLGALSYGIYIYHGTLIPWLKDHGVANAFPLGDWLGLVLAGTVATVGVAAVSWYLLERPILRRWSTSIAQASTRRLDAAARMRTRVPRGLRRLAAQLGL